VSPTKQQFTSMTNIFTEPVKITLGGSPGEAVTEFVINPGEAQDFPRSLCEPVPGAGSENLPPILERKSMRTWNDGKRRPTLIPTEEFQRQQKAKAAKAAPKQEAR
jgi:hypothetical protein